MNKIFTRQITDDSDDNGDKPVSSLSIVISPNLPLEPKTLYRRISVNNLSAPRSILGCCSSYLVYTQTGDGLRFGLSTPDRPFPVLQRSHELEQRG